jgi:hypothetical protein
LNIFYIDCEPKSIEHSIPHCMIPEYSLIIAFAIYFFVVSYLAFLNPIYISIRKVYLFRCLFPSWKFYEDICYLPVLYFRQSTDKENFGNWEEVIPKIDRKWKNIFVNAEGNLIHAYNTLLLQLENDKEEVIEGEDENFVNSVSYRLVRNLVELKLKSSYSNSKYFQFKVTSQMQGDRDDFEDTLVSIIHEVEK